MERWREFESLVPSFSHSPYLKNLCVSLRVLCASAVKISLLLLIACTATQAQQVQIVSKPNPQIEKILKESSASNIEASIRKLVSFGTRHTLSSQDDPNRGIGAARKWIREEFDRYSKDCGGRLVISEDDFIQPAGGRVPQPTRLVNIIATLPGTQTESKDRIYVVSGAL